MHANPRQSHGGRDGVLGNDAESSYWVRRVQNYGIGAAAVTRRRHKNSPTEAARIRSHENVISSLAGAGRVAVVAARRK